MTRVNSFFRLSFLPRHYDLGLLILRVTFGVSLCILHGWGKVVHFSQMSGHFPDPVHIGPVLSLLFAILSDVVSALLVALGIAARWAALIIAINTGVAFTLVHHLALSGPGGGELALLYFSWALTIFITGPGRYSFDRL